MSSERAKAFVARWTAASASERANSQPFLCGLCDILGVALPEPTPEAGYAFEYDVTEHHPDGSTTKVNSERAKEEASGLVRWLRPDYQNPGGGQTQQAALAVELEPQAKPGKSRPGKLPWPKTLAERVKAVSAALAGVKEPVTAAEIARHFARARAVDADEILETLCAVGKARRGQVDGTFLP